jgi:AraC-like DNA-binding protein
MQGLRDMKRGEPYIRAINLLGGDSFFTRQGCDFNALLEEVGIPLSSLTALDSLISYPSFVTLIETGASRSGNENFGLQLSQSLAPDYACLGPSIIMARFTKTVGEWAENVIRYWSHHTNGFTLKLMPAVESGETILRVQFNMLAVPTRHFTDSTVANIVGVVRTVAEAPHENPSRVCFSYRRPASTALHEEIFRCPVEFGCEHTEIRCPTHYLENPTTGSMRLLQPLMRLYISERIRNMHIFDHSAAATVALAIPSLLGSGDCSIEAIAQSLGTNIKALQRQLDKESKSYSDILDEVRETMSRHLLTESEAAVSRIAGLLDYTGTAPFSMAFRRWTGQTPLEYRKRSRAI